MYQVQWHTHPPPAQHAVYSNLKATSPALQRAQFSYISPCSRSALEPEQEEEEEASTKTATMEESTASNSIDEQSLNNSNNFTSSNSGDSSNTLSNNDNNCGVMDSNTSCSFEGNSSSSGSSNNNNINTENESLAPNTSEDLNYMCDNGIYLTMTSKNPIYENMPTALALNLRHNDDDYVPFEGTRAATFGPQYENMSPQYIPPSCVKKTAEEVNNAVDTPTKTPGLKSMTKVRFNDVKSSDELPKSSTSSFLKMGFHNPLQMLRNKQAAVVKSRLEASKLVKISRSTQTPHLKVQWESESDLLAPHEQWQLRLERTRRVELERRTLDMAIEIGKFNDQMTLSKESKTLIGLGTGMRLVISVVFFCSNIIYNISQDVEFIWNTTNLEIVYFALLLVLTTGSFILWTLIVSWALTRTEIPFRKCVIGPLIMQIIVAMLAAIASAHGIVHFVHEGKSVWNPIVRFGITMVLEIDFLFVIMYYYIWPPALYSKEDTDPEKDEAQGRESFPLPELEPVPSPRFQIVPQITNCVDNPNEEQENIYFEIDETERNMKTKKDDNSSLVNYFTTMFENNHAETASQTEQ